MTKFTLSPFRASRNDHPMSIWNEMNRLFEDFPQRFNPQDQPDFLPAMDVKETDKLYTIISELPGMDEKDIDLSLKDGQLHIKGEKKLETKEEGETHLRVERAYGSFHRSVALPSDVDPDKVDATFEKGVLTIQLHKSAAPKQTRIAIKSK